MTIHGCARKGTMWVAAALAGAAALAATPLPQGTFSGTGRWVGRGGAAGDYAVAVMLEGATLTGTYRHPGREDRTFLRFAAADGPFYDVLDEKGSVVGNGYCHEGECTYHASFGEVRVEETLRVAGGRLQRLGSKRGPGFEVVWREDLKPGAAAK